MKRDWNSDDILNCIKEKGYWINNPDSWTEITDSSRNYLLSIGAIEQNQDQSWANWSYCYVEKKG